MFLIATVEVVLAMLKVAIVLVVLEKSVSMAVVIARKSGSCISSINREVVSVV